MLSKHNLYPNTGGSMLPSSKMSSYIDKILWILFKTNGKRTVEEIRKDLKFTTIHMNQIIKTLKIKKIINHI